jgi:hypothetical protein
MKRGQFAPPDATCGRPCSPSELDLDSDLPLSARSGEKGPIGRCRHCAVDAPLSHAYTLQLSRMYMPITVYC